MSSSVPIPTAEMTPSSDPQPPDPAVAAAPDAGRAPGLLGRARAAARPVSFTGPLITVIVLLAGAVGGFVLRELDSLDTDIGNLEADVDQLRADVNQLRADVDAKFVELEAEVDARFDELEAEMGARFDELEAGQQQIALTLTALVAYLRADEGVDAALSGRLLDPGADPAEARSAQPQADATAAGAGGSTGGGRAPASAG